MVMETEIIRWVRMVSRNRIEGLPCMVYHAFFKPVQFLVELFNAFVIEILDHRCRYQQSKYQQYRIPVFPNKSAPFFHATKLSYQNSVWQIKGRTNPRQGADK